MFKAEKSITVTEKDLEVVRSALDAVSLFCDNNESIAVTLRNICDDRPYSFTDDLCEDVIIHYVEEEETPKNAKVKTSDNSEATKWENRFRIMCDHFDSDCTNCPFDCNCPLV